MAKKQSFDDEMDAALNDRSADDVVPFQPRAEAPVAATMRKSMEKTIEERLAADGRAILEVDTKYIDETEYRDRLDISFTDAKFISLKESIREHGQISPVGLRLVGEKYEIAWGHRRVRACQEIGVKVRAIVISSKENTYLVRMMLLENTHREDVSPYERALNIAKLLGEQLMSSTEIMEILDIKKAALSHYTTLARFPEDVLSAIADPREMSMTKGADFVRQWEKADKRLQRKAVEALETLDKTDPDSVMQTILLHLTPKEEQATDDKHEPEVLRTANGQKFATVTSQRGQRIVRFAAWVNDDRVDKLLRDLAASYENDP